MKKIVGLHIFLLIPLIASGQGLRCNVVNCNDPRTLFLSPAAMAFQHVPQFVAGYELYHLGLEGAGLKNGFAGLVYPGKQFGSVSLTGQYFSSEIYRTGSLGLGYGRLLGSQRFSLGFELGLAFISYAEDNFKLKDPNDPVFARGTSKSALDLGLSLLLNPFDPLFCGFAIKHLNQPDISLAEDKVRLPLQFHSGLLFQTSMASPLLHLSYENEKIDFYIGLERWFLNQQFMVRANYYRYDLGASAALVLPFQHHWLRVEYEYRYPLSELSQVSSASHLFLISYRLSTPSRDFEIRAEKTSQSVFPGETARYRIDIKRIGNFTEPIRLSVIQADKNLDYSLLPMRPNDDLSTILAVSPSDHCPPGDYHLQIMAQAHDKGKSLPISLTVKKRPILQADVVASVDRLMIRETTRIFSRDPLLPYIFFDEGQAALNDKRYDIFNPEQHPIKNFVFSPEKLRDIPTKYRNTLNVIASRLWDHPEMEIIVRGYNADWGSEKGDLQLSRRRAETVRDYLVKNCGVNPKQIRVEAYGLPPDPASNIDPRGREENQRVEITCPPPSQLILDPIVTETSEIASSDDQCDFHIQNFMAEAGLKKWQLIILADPQDTFKVFAGTNTIPPETVWDWKNDLGQSVSVGKTYHYQLSLWDELGQNFSSDQKAIQVERISEVAREYIQKNIEKTRLILFKYDRADLDLSLRSLREELELNVQKLRDYSEATLLIQGYTDVIGDPEYNLKLSLRRAESVAQYFIDRGISKSRITFQGFGMNRPLMENDLPEGRMMNRRVEIYILY